MKHTIQVTLALVLFFFLAQFTGLLIVNEYIDHKKTTEAKAIVMKPLPYGLERPEVKNQSTSFLYIITAILIGTGIMLIIAKANITIIWKLMFFVAVSVTLSVAFAAFLNVYIAGILAVAISIFRLYKPNIVIHNLSEIFIYGGIAAIMVNIFNLFAAFMLLILISIYDYISVFKTKHMIKLAKFQSKARVFAGLFIPYGKEKPAGKEILGREPVKAQKSMPKSSVAVLGGGDIGFTLIFAGVVMKSLMLKETILAGFLKTLIIPIFVSIALLILLIKGKENKFYPAMPVLSLGCFLGYLAVLAV
ncbi:hypothetical protein HYT53_03875 [Candidatus Woesearchaeota archaeon]|nr:hypothetical protein [Candidatus Woesearchaeota archaeon]